MQDTSMCIFSFEDSSFPPSGAAAAAPGLLRRCARGPRGVHNLCKTHVVYSLFLCVLYFPRHACFFWFWIVVARAAGHASTAVNLPFPSLLGHHSVGFCVCFWCSGGFCFVQSCSSSRGSFRVPLRGSSLLLCVSSLYSSRLFLSLGRRNHPVSFQEKEKCGFFILSRPFEKCHFQVLFTLKQVFFHGLASR